MVKSQNIAAARHKIAQALREGLVLVRRIQLGPVIAVSCENTFKTTRDHVGIAAAFIGPARHGGDITITPAGHLAHRHLFKATVDQQIGTFGAARPNNLIGIAGRSRQRIEL